MKFHIKGWPYLKGTYEGWPLYEVLDDKLEAPNSGHACMAWDQPLQKIYLFIELSVHSCMYSYF